MSDEREFMSPDERTYAWPRTEVRFRSFREWATHMGNNLPDELEAPVTVEYDESTGRLAKNKKKRKHTPKRRRQLLAAYGPFCYLCHRSFEHDPDSLRVEHRVPLGRGGQDRYQNLGLACAECDIAKGMMTEQEFRLHRESQR